MFQILSFDDYELDLSCFELRRAGRSVSVQPKVLRLLVHLVTNRSRSVSNDELLEVLWLNETVSRASIKRAVRGARKALGDAGDAQSYIRTVRGYGYRFVLPVRESLYDASAFAALASQKLRPNLVHPT